MNKNIKFIVGVLAFVLFISGSVYAYNNLSDKNKPNSILAPTEKQDIAVEDKQGDVAEAENNGEEQKTPAPDFTVFDAEGNEVKFSEMVGKPIVLNFWASWCPPCKKEMPDFQKVYDELGNEVTFMMVDLVGGRETKESGEKHIKDNNFTFPVYFDTNQDAAYVYGISSIPTSIFIDAEGNIVNGAQGAIDEETLRYAISLIYEK